MRLQVTRAPVKFISLGIFLNSGASSSNMVCGSNSRSTKTTRGKYHITSLLSDSAIRHSEESLHSAESTMFRSLKAFRYSSSTPHTQRSRLTSMKDTVLSVTAYGQISISMISWKCLIGCPIWRPCMSKIRISFLVELF